MECTAVRKVLGTLGVHLLLVASMPATALAFAVPQGPPSGFVGIREPDFHGTIDEEMPVWNGLPSKHDEPLPTDNDTETASCGVSQLSLQSTILQDLSEFDTGDPVGLHNGMVSVRRTDMFIAGRGIDFEFTRRYNSKLAATDGVLGYGWDHSYNIRLQLGSTIVLWNGNQRSDTYTQSGGGVWQSPAGVYTTLTQDNTGPTIYTVRARHGSITKFNSSGTLISQEDASGNKLTFQYSSGELASITDTLGRVVTLTYDSNGRLEALTDYTGREVEYGYSSSGDLTSVRSPTVTSTSGWNEFSGGRTEAYEYGTFHLLEKIFKPNDLLLTIPVASVEFEYLQWGSSHHWCTKQRQDDDWIHYQYINTSGVIGAIAATLVTNAAGNVTSYAFDQFGHALHIGKANGLHVYEFEYNSEGQLTQTIFPEGNEEVRVYDTTNPFSVWARGNLMSIELVPKSGSPLGSIVSEFVWEPLYQHICKTTDPLGNETQYICDYMEASSFSGSNSNQTALEAIMGMSLSGTGSPFIDSMFPWQDADVNSDAVIAATQGKLVKRVLPTATISSLGSVAGQGAVEGDNTQHAFATYTYNGFGQMTSETDEEENVTIYVYHPQNDPDGNGVTDSGLSSTPGGYLKTEIVDTHLPYTAVLPGVSTRPGMGQDIGRDSARDPRRTEKTTDWLYDSLGHVTSISDARGIKTTYSVNELGEVWQIEHADSVADAATKKGGVDPTVAESLAAIGYVEKFRYDENGNIILRAHEASGFHTGAGDGGSISGYWETEYTYDSLDRLLTVEREVDSTNPALVWTYAYNGNGQLASVTEPEGNVTEYLYDDRDLLDTIKQGPGDPEEIETAITYTDNGLQRDVSVGPGIRTTRHFYDGVDRLERVINPVGSETEYTYDDASNVTEIMHSGTTGSASPNDPNPEVNAGSNVALSKVLFVYDERNRMIQRDFEAPSGQSALTDGVLSVSDGKVSARFDYDRLSRIMFSIEDDGKKTAVQFDGASRILVNIDAAGNEVKYGYDDNDNLIKATEKDLYPSGGSVTDRSYVTFDIYDALNRRTATRDPIGQTHRFTYDSMDNVVTVTDAQAGGTGTIDGVTVNDPGNERRFFYNGLGQLFKEEYDVTSNSVNTDGKVTILQEWDDNGRLVAKTDDNGNETSWQYDSVNNVVQETYADSTQKSMTYDAVGDLDTVTNARGDVATLTYDRAGRLINVSTALGSSTTYDASTNQTFEYDGLNRQTLSFDNNSSGTGDDWTVTRTYDAMSRLLEENQGGQTVTNMWKEEGKRTTLVYPSSSSNLTLAYAYDDLDRISTIATNGTNLVTYQYAGPGRLFSRQIRIDTSKSLTERYHDGTGQDSSYYDGARRPIRLETVNRIGVIQSAFEHGFDRSNARTFERRIHDSSKGDHYENDELSRLTRFDRQITTPASPGTTPTREWELDGVHNWGTVADNGGTSYPNSVNTVNAYTDFLGGAPVHDEDGNLQSPDNNAGTPVTLFFDALNRLRLIDDGTDYVQHDYDAGGRRVRTTTSVSAAPATTVFLYDGWDVIEERNGITSSSGITRRYVGGATIDEPLRLENLSYPGTTTGTYYYQRSTLGNIVALTDTGGVVVERYTYDAYGAPQFEDASNIITSATESDVGNPYLFNARRYEGALIALYDCRFRSYSPSQGRFIQRDPIGAWTDSYAGGSAYAFVAASPGNVTDPFGLLQDLPTLTDKQLDTTINSLKQNVHGHADKIREHAKDPHAVDELGHLDGGVHDTKKIEGRQTTLKGQFKKNLMNFKKALAEKLRRKGMRLGARKIPGLGLILFGWDWSTGDLEEALDDMLFPLPEAVEAFTPPTLPGPPPSVHRYYLPMRRDRYKPLPLPGPPPGPPPVQPRATGISEFYEFNVHGPRLPLLVFQPCGSQ